MAYLLLTRFEDHKIATKTWMKYVHRIRWLGLSLLSIAILDRTPCMSDLGHT